MSPAIVGLAIIITIATRSALAILRQLDNQGASTDIQVISDLAVQSSTSNTAVYQGSLLLIVCCWIFSIIDAYRIGKKSPS